MPHARLTTIHSIALDALRRSREARISTMASSLAYTTILSLIPFLAVSLALFKGFGGLDKLYAIVEPFLIENLSTGSGEDAAQTIRGFIGNLHTASLGAGGFVGLVVTTILLLNSADTAIQQIWGILKQRPWGQRLSYYWAIVSFGPVALAGALGALSASNLQLPPSLMKGWGNVAIPFSLFVLAYRFTPLTKVNWRPALISAAAASIATGLAGGLYGLYVKHFVSYNKIYGSLGAVPILLVWIYVLWTIVLWGAVLCAALQGRKETHAATPKKLHPEQPPTQPMPRKPHA